MKYRSTQQIFSFQGRRAKSLPKFNRRILGSLLDFVARELQVQTKVVAAVTAGVVAECSSPRIAKAKAETAAQLSMVLVENAIVIVMLVEDHLQLQSELCSVSSLVNRTISPLTCVPPASN
ncbi:hypothetical protein Nepgr_008756 [Nepenthes gracilis]|uniref:Uncharacterized protein n=1 Tax=Nepenthes gracilis TaxID=150966 RepID=A0AAD3XJR7_NEPGR|nr:hypothetical protein Nepgr_008756 [Nepenthes gracilis]